MKHFFTTLILCSISALLNAQSFWAQGTGGNDVDETMSMCFDNSGNIVSAGYFTSIATFGASTTLTSASMGVPDIYVSKSNSSGVIQWVVQAGGIGSDRALSVKSDATGNIYITGFYYGTATFGPYILTSVNGTQDIFIAKLNSAGAFIWAKSAGGNMADIGNAIDVDVNGNVLVTGQFQGTATFGTSTLISMMNPQINLPSLDIFTAKYDNNGIFLWVRQGTAKYTDRGLAIASDANGNIFICGQFSDTIVFNQVHNNPVMNAIFLIKYDANGNEVWFRKASGTYSIAYSLLVNSNKDIYMTGDFQGNLAFYGPPNNFISDTYSKCIFLVKYDNNGNFIWAKSESSDNYISSRSVALDPNGDPYIAGEFGCTLNKFADVFGQGTFNSIGYQDIFTVKYNASSGHRQWMRNFGSAGNDQVHGILVNTIDNPIIAGSYEKSIYWAENSLNVTTNNPQLGLSTNTAFCSDASYGTFKGMKSAGFSDGFIAQAVDTSRQPYDYYHRIGNSCLRGFVGGCIDSAAYQWPYPTSIQFLFNCPDTITFCGTGFLFANSKTGSGIKNILMPPNYDYCSVGPNYKYQWSSSAFSTTSYIDTITTTNNYILKMTTVDGCYTSQDTIYAIVHPIPQPPTITDNKGINNNQPQCGMLIEKCRPDTILLTGGNVNGNSISWYKGPNCNQNTATSPCFLGGTLLTNNDSLSVSASGFYNVVLTNQYGCKNSNCVPVLIDTMPPNIIPKSLIPDTLAACYGSQVYLEVIDSVTGSYGPFTGLTNNWSSNPSIAISNPWPLHFNLPFYLGGIFTAQTSGTYIVTDNIVLHNACGTKNFSVSDTFYLLVNPTPTVTISNNQTICPGQNATINASGGISYSWFVSGQTTSTIVVNPAVSTGYTVMVTNSLGCTELATDSVIVYPNPIISTSPASGLICPNDSVLLISNTVGTNYQWIGPIGILPFNSQSIYQDIPGFYHCIVTNMAGCVLTSNTAELKQYNTPYLIPTPTNIVCVGQSVTLQVVTNDTTLIQWNPPLSGGSTYQIVNQSGVYSCNVTMCGVTTLCTMPVVVSQGIAQISGPASVCPGDSVLLTANSGMIGYQWSPLYSYFDSIYVHSGTYSLITTDANGCTASASATVVLDTSVTKPSGHDTTICAGTSAALFATGIGPIEWYATLTSTTPIFTGNPFTTPTVTTQTTYYIATSNLTGCHSLRDSVKVFINPTSLTPSMTVTSPVCSGSNIIFSTPNQQNATYSWTGPNGFVSSQQNPNITNASSVNSGTYTLIVSGNGCVSLPATDTVLVISVITPTVTGTDTVCSGDSILINVANPTFNATYYWNGPSGFSSSGTSVTIFPANAINSGTYTLYSSINGCISATASFNIFVKPTGSIVSASSNGPICSGDALHLSANGGNIYNWTGPLGFSSTTQNPTIVSATTANTGTYSVSAMSNGCSLIPSYVNVVVNALPILSLGADTAICSNQPLLLQPSGNYSSYQWNDNTTNNSILVSAGGAYSLTITDTNGCKATSTINIGVITCNPTPTNVFTPNGDGINDVFNFSDLRFKKVQCKIYDRWGRKIYSWDDPNGGWDGTDFQTKLPASVGTYYYIAVITSYDDTTTEMRGFIDLIR